MVNPAKRRMHEAPLNWLDIAGVREPDGGPGALERARLAPEQPSAHMYRSEADLAEWAAGLTADAAAGHASSLASMAIDAAAGGAAVLREWLKAIAASGNAFRRAQRTRDDAYAIAAWADCSRSRLAIARYVALTSLARAAADGGDAPGQIGSLVLADAATAASAASAAAESLAAEAKIEAARHLAGDRAAMAVKDIRGPGRRGTDSYRELAGTIENLAERHS